jgi:peptidoglycan-associated lipoprotein
MRKYLDYRLILIFSLLVFAGSCKTPPPVEPPPPPIVEEQPPPPPPPSPTVAITASSNSIVRGEQTTLSWSSMNGASLSIDNGVGNVGLSGQLIVTPNQSTTYTATVKGNGGEARASSRVTVTEPVVEAPIVRSDSELLEESIKSGKVGTIYFGYDKAALSDESQEILRKNAAVLKRYSSARFVIEGHCDERGSDEYNLALGDKRSATVRSFLAGLGVSASRMESVSFGEEKPASTEKTEAGYAKNRRAAFTVNR